MKVVCDYNFLDAPNFDILLIPGGKGTRKLISNKSVLSWIYNRRNTKLIISICTGSLLLAASGLLKNKKATTHWSAFNLLKDISPSTSVLKRDMLWIKFFLHQE